MITVYIYTNLNGDVYSFKVNDHGADIVCAAVSALALNTVNSIEVFTSEPFNCNFEEDGGFLSIEVPSLKENKLINDVSLLLNSFFLGIKGIKEDYDKDIKLIVNEEVY